ncbi:MAG TPA: hydroxymethylbilane synthase [Candidatus Udaeobacter sp.]|nr:hydroxymethylbilane synthase [Candidatus Udaeobacter sp.]
MAKKIVLGTRGSELARAQAHLVEKAIQATRPDLKIETKIIVTKGDKGGAADLRHGRKGLFTAEIERALLAGDADVAVHSAKDLPSEMSLGAEIAAVLPRAPTEDVLVSRHRGGLAALQQGATIATGSVRRKHQLLWKWPNLKIVDLRGNVPTRLRKLAENDWEAIVLARAGLERLGLSPTQAEIEFEDRKLFLGVLPRKIFLSAGGQGIIAMQIRANDERIRAIVGRVNDRETLRCLRAEREFLRLLHGDCNSPVGVLATVKDGVMKLRGQLFDQGLGAPRKGDVEGEFEDGEALAARLLRRINGE